MSKVHAVTARPASRVEEERFPLFVSVKNGVELAVTDIVEIVQEIKPEHYSPMRKEHPPAN